MRTTCAPCKCELRDRQWNGFGRCLRCGAPYVDQRLTKLTLVDLWRAVKTWRETRCPHASGAEAARRLGVPWELCDGDNHIADCPVELARQDVIATHDRTSP